MISHLYILEFTGGSSFANRWTSPFLSEPGDPDDETRICGIDVADTDKDGFSEVLLGSVYGQIIIFESAGNNTYSNTPRLNEVVDVGVGGTFDWCDLTVDDVDGDGNLDIIYVSEDDDRAWIYEASGNNNWAQSWNEVIESTGNMLRVATGDSDGDGQKEFVITYRSPDGAAVYETFGDNNYAAVFQTTDPTMIPESPNGVQLVNLDTDSGQEILLGSEFYGYWIWQFSDSADLAINDWDIQFAPSTLAEGESVAIEATVSNLSGSEVSNVKVDFFSGDPSNSGALLGSDTIPILAAGSPETVSIQWTFETKNSYDIYVVVDPDDSVPETDENNNQAISSLAVSDNDIDPPTIGNVSVEEHLGDGDGLFEDNEEFKVTWDSY